MIRSYWIGIVFILFGLGISPDAQSQCPQRVMEGTGSGGVQSFGERALALEGDLAAIGARNDQTVGIFHRQGILWQSLSWISSPAFGFGRSLELSGGVLAVGSELGNLVGVYRWDGTTFLPEQELRGQNNCMFLPGFGWDVALDGNVLVVGEPCKDRAQVYRFQGGTWSREATLPDPDNEGTREFGSAVDVLGNTLVIGNPGADVGGHRSGAAYVYQYDGASWSLEQKCRPVDPALVGGFGRELELEEGLLLVGAPFTDEAGIQAGAAFLFRHQGGGWVEEEKFLPDVTQQERFGQSLVLHQDWLALGAPGATTGCPATNPWCYAGAVAVYRRLSGSWVRDKNLLPVSPRSDAGFGSGMARDGNRLVIGEPGDFFSTEGQAFITEVQPLSLQADPVQAVIGDDITLSSCGGVPSEPALLVLTEVDGLPTFHAIPFPVFFDGVGQWQHSGTLLRTGGIQEVRLQVLSRDGSGNWILSNPAILHWGP